MAIPSRDSPRNARRADRDRLARDSAEPEQAMREAAEWIASVCSTGEPVLVAYPLGFDWMWLIWYFIRFLGTSPFKHSRGYEHQDRLRGEGAHSHRTSWASESASRVAPLHPDCRFLYRAALDALSHGEGRVANSATYAALLAAPFFEEEPDQRMVALALKSAADDVRIAVAHGAAFASGYWLGLQVQSPLLRETACEVRDSFKNDPSAMIHRQYQFGWAKGRFARASANFGQNT